MVTIGHSYRLYLTNSVSDFGFFNCQCDAFTSVAFTSVKYTECPTLFWESGTIWNKKKYLVNVDKRKPFMTIVKILVKYVQDVVLNVGDLSSQGTSPHVWKHSDYCNSGLLLVSSRQRQGMLLDFIQYTGQPLKTKKYLIADVSSRRDPDLERQNIHQHNSFRFFFFFVKVQGQSHMRQSFSPMSLEC